MYANTDIASAGSRRRLKERLGSCLAAIGAYHNARRDRIRLSQMSDHMLSDIGLTRDDVRYMKPAPFRHFVG